MKIAVNSCIIVIVSVLVVTGSADLAYQEWMTNLDPELTSISLAHLSVPGSHDSFSFSIKRNNPYERSKETLGTVLKIFNLENLWSKTMDANFTEQLDAGIRYFDLRVLASHESGLHFVHGQLANEVDHDLAEIRSFLRLHPKEVIILDFNHIYVEGSATRLDMENELHRLIMKHFDSIAHKWTSNFTVPSLDEMWKNDVQVLLFTDAHNYVSTGDKISPTRACLESNWPNTNDYNTLKASWPKVLNKRAQNKDLQNKLVVLQAVLTPQRGDFFMRNSLRALTRGAHLMLKDWLLNYVSVRNGPLGVNIVIADYCVKSYKTFAQDIININFKGTVRAPPEAPWKLTYHMFKSNQPF